MSLGFSDCPESWTYAAINPDAPVTRTRLPLSIATILFDYACVDSTSGKDKDRTSGMKPQYIFIGSGGGQSKWRWRWDYRGKWSIPAANHSPPDHPLPGTSVGDQA